MITGTPGSGKTLYAVSLIIDLEKQNTKNLPLNPAIYEHNKKIIEENNLEHEFHHALDLKDNVQLFDDDYFDLFKEAERHELYYQKSTFYNSIVQRVKETYPDLKLKELKPVRTIYADINGLKIPHLRKSPDDWRDAPDGSIIFYDEIQQRATYKEERKTNDIIEGLQTHRHRGFDIYAITQFPSLVHSNFRAVVGLHYHLHRGWGMPSATVYVWAYVVINPNDAGKKALSERSFRFNYPKDLFKYYKSATVHTHKMRIPQKFIFIVFGILVAGFFAGKQLFFTDNFLTQVAGSESQKDAKPKAQVIDTLTPEQRADLEARSPVRTNPTQNQVNQATYNPNKPFDNQFDNVQIVNNQPFLSGCMQLKNKCSCFTQQGSKLDVSIADCKKVINDGMPYNPFLTRTGEAAVQSSVPNV